MPTSYPPEGAHVHVKQQHRGRRMLLLYSQCKISRNVQNPHWRLHHFWPRQSLAGCDRCPIVIFLLRWTHERLVLLRNSIDTNLSLSLFLSLLRNAPFFRCAQINLDCQMRIWHSTSICQSFRTSSNFVASFWYRVIYHGYKKNHRIIMHFYNILVWLL